MHLTLQGYSELGFLAVGQDQPQKLHCEVTHGALEAEEEDYSEKQYKQWSFRLEAHTMFVKDVGKTREGTLIC
jgi:hypothetical protein